MANGTLTLGGIQYEVVAVDKTKDGLDTAKSNLKDFEKTNNDTLSNIIDSYGLLALKVGIAMVAVQQAYANTVGAAVAYQDQIDDMHNMLGVTIEDAQKWRAASIATDTSLSSVTTSMRYLTQRISDSGEAGDNLRATLKGIGVDAKDASGKYKDSSQLFQEILLALNKIPAGTERSSKAAEIFGRNWYNIADMIDNADTAVKTFKATESTLTTEDSEKIERFKIKWAQLAEKIELAKVNLGLWIVESAEADEQMSAKNTVLDRLLAGKGLSAFVPGPEDWAGTKKGASGGADYTSAAQLAALSKSQDLVAGSTENLFLNLTDTEREIKYQTEVVIPKYEEALKAAEAAGKGVAEAQYNLANAMDHLNDLKTQDTDRTKAQTAAYKDHVSEVEKLNEAKKKLYDLDRDYSFEMQSAGMDVAAGRKATMSFLRQREGLIEGMGEAQMGVTEAATEFNEIKAGTPLEQIKGTDQYDKAQATTIEKIVIENVNLSPDYTANDFMSDLTAGRIAKGVPISR